MLPSKLRLWLFDRLSVKTMRYVTAVPRKKAVGLTKRVYDMIEDDFFVNGSLTSRSRVPNLMAAIWTSGRETMLVDDHLDRTTKEAICGVLSDLNDCPYCGDMLISLVDAGEQHDAAAAIYASTPENTRNPRLRDQLAWVHAVGTPGQTGIPSCPYTDEELPEVLGSLMAMADINRFSHVVMDGSPVELPFGLQRPALRLFGHELKATKRRSAAPGRSLGLLPPAKLPEDLAWAAPNPRIADAIARWTAAVERETAGVISPAVRECVEESLRGWKNERMPLSRSWVDAELTGLEGEDRAIARLAILLAKAPHQVSEDIVEDLVTDDEARFVRILAWASFVGARRFVAIVADRVKLNAGGSSSSSPSATPLPAHTESVGVPCRSPRGPRIGKALLLLSLVVAGCHEGLGWFEVPPLTRVTARAGEVAHNSVVITWSSVSRADSSRVYRDDSLIGQAARGRPSVTAESTCRLVPRPGSGRELVRLS